MEPEDRHDDFEEPRGDKVNFEVTIEMYEGFTPPNADQIRDRLISRAPELVNAAAVWVVEG